MSIKEGIWIVDNAGQEQLLSYDDLELEVISANELFKPIGGFCYEASVFKRLALTSSPFWVEGWLPKRGKAIFYGSSKVGKSYLALQLARCIGAGTPFLGIPTTQGLVLYLQFELDTKTLQARMLTTGKDYPNVFVGTSFSLKLDVTTGISQVKRALDAINPDVLILDPFYKIISGEETNSHDVMRIFDNVDLLIEAFGCSVVIMHHAGKNVSLGSRGSSTFGDYPDSSIELSKSKQTLKLTPRLLRHAELPPDSIEATFSNGEFILKVDPMNPTIADKILAYMQGKEVVTVADIETQNFGARRSVFLALSALEDCGAITHTTRGCYAKANSQDVN